MRPDLKVKVARRKHTIDVLRWVYARRDATLDGARLSLDHRHRQEGGVAETKPLTYGEVSSGAADGVVYGILHTLRSGKVW